MPNKNCRLIKQERHRQIKKCSRKQNKRGRAEEWMRPRVRATENKARGGLSTDAAATMNAYAIIKAI